MKICSLCKKEKQDEFFYSGFHNGDRRRKYLSARCKNCHNYKREERRKRLRYNCTEDQYQKRLKEQGGGCAICGYVPKLEARKLAIDHDHKCCGKGKSCGRCIRGLLCMRCNRGLSYYKDNPVFLQNAANYLAKFKKEL
jgi:hypothetical protein